MIAGCVLKQEPYMWFKTVFMLHQHVNTPLPSGMLSSPAARSDAL